MEGKRANNMSSKLTFARIFFLLKAYVFQLKPFARMCCKNCCILSLNDEFLLHF